VAGEIQRYDARDQEIQELKQTIQFQRERLAEKEGEIARLKNEKQVSLGGVLHLRKVLNPLYQGLQQIFGEIDNMDLPVDAAASESGASSKVNPQKAAVWDSWKQKMGGNSAAARIIDALLLHSELTATQLSIHIGTSRMQTVYDAVSRLNKAGVLQKSGDRYRLKEI
jgi:hypothetical protein